MSGRFTLLLRRHEGPLIHAWADELYRDRRTHLPELLSYSQLVEPFAEIFAELGQHLDERGGEVEAREAAYRLRFFAQVRFQQRALIDEVARELIILRRILNDFLWHEGVSATEGNLWELRQAMRRTDHLVDELLAQTLVIYAASWRPPVMTRVPWRAPPAAARAHHRPYIYLLKDAPHERG